MRIIAGTHRGRRIAAPKGRQTRPTSDRVRETAFNLIGPVDGAAVLDLFAGSGALGLEALSRGAGALRLRRVRPRGLPDDQREPRQARPARRPSSARTSLRAARARARPPTTSSSATRPTTTTTRPARAAPRPPARRRRPARLRDLGPRPTRPSCRASRCAPPASTAPRALRCSSRDHRDLPRHVRPRHERARRRDHARRADLRPRRRRRRRQPAPQDADVRGRGARRSSSATRSRASSTTSRSTSSSELVVDFARRWDAKVIVKGLRVDLGLRVGVPDEPAEPPPRARHRDRLRDGEPAGQLRLVERREGDCLLRRKCRRAGAEGRRARA